MPESDKWLVRLAPDRWGRRPASRQILLGKMPKQRSGAREPEPLDVDFS
jgi:hypothetical protein